MTPVRQHMGTLAPTTAEAFLLRYERFYPLAFGAFSTVAFYFAQRHHWIVSDLTVALSAFTTIAAIAIGFLSTAKSILLSIQDTKDVMVGLRANPGIYNRILRFMKAAINWCFLSALMSTATLLVDKVNLATLHNLMIHAVILTGVTAGFACYRITTVFFRILSAPD